MEEQRSSKQAKNPGGETLLSPCPAQEQSAAINGLASKIALTVRLMTVVQTSVEKSKAQDMLERLLIEFAEELLKTERG